MKTLLMAVLTLALAMPAQGIEAQTPTLEDQIDDLIAQIEAGEVGSDRTYCATSLVPCLFVCWPVDGVMAAFVGTGGVTADCGSAGGASCTTSGGACVGGGSVSGLAVGTCEPHAGSVGTAVCGSPWCFRLCSGESSQRPAP